MHSTGNQILHKIGLNCDTLVDNKIALTRNFIANLEKNCVFFKNVAVNMGLKVKVKSLMLKVKC